MSSKDMDDWLINADKEVFIVILNIKYWKSAQYQEKNLILSKSEEEVHNLIE